MNEKKKIDVFKILAAFTLIGCVPCTTSGGNQLPPLSKSIHLSVPPSHTALSGDLHVQVTGTWPSSTKTNNSSSNNKNSETASNINLYIRLSRLDGDITHVLYTALARPDARTTSVTAASGSSSRNGKNITKTNVVSRLNESSFSASGTVISGTTVLRIPCGLFSKGGEYYVELVRVKEGNETFEGEAVVEDEDKVAKGLDVRWPLPRLSLTPEHVQTYPESPVTAILEFPEVMCPPVADNAPSAIPEFWLELHYCGHSLLTCDNGNKTNAVQVLYSEQIRGFPGRRIITLRCELFGLAGHYALVLRPTIPMPSLSNTAAYVKADWSEQFVFNVHARSILPCDVHSGGITVLFQYPSCILSSGDRVRLYARLRADVASLAPPTSMEYVAEKRVVRGQHALHFECDLFSERFVEYCFTYVSQAITGAVADVRMDCVPTLPVSESESGGWGAWSPWTACSTTCAGGTRNRYRFCDSPPPRYGAKFCEGAAVETEKCGSNEASDTNWECLYGASDTNIGAIDEVSPADRPEILAEVGPGCRCGCVVHLGQAKPRRLLATSSHSCPGRTFWLIQADDNHIVRFKVDHYRLPCGSQWLKVRDGNSLSATLLAQLSGGEDRRTSGAPATVQSTGQHLLLEFFSDELELAGGEMCGGGFLAHAQQMRLSSVNTTVLHPAVSISAAAAAAAPVGVATGARLTAVHVAALLLASVVLVATALLAAQYVLRYRKYHIAEDMDSLADSNASLAIRARASSSATLLSEVISLTRLRPPGTAKNRHTRLRESMDLDCGEREACVDDEVETELVHDDRVGSGQIEHMADGSHSSTMTLTPPEHPTTPKIPLAAPEKDSSSSPGSASASISISPGPSLRSETSVNIPPTSLEKSSRMHQQYSPEERNITPISIGNSTSSGISGSTSSTPIPGGRKYRGHHRKLSASMITSAALINGCYSPAASIISTATIRSTNPKESKEKRNRERLLAGPGSEFSLAGPDADLELDYYDYNVVNAGAVPGSYLGMDPQYLVWIPPLDESGEILQNLDKVEKYPFEYEDIRPKQFIDPGSNQESPEEEMLLPRRRKSLSEGVTNTSPLVLRKKIHPLIIDTSSMGENETDLIKKDIIPLLKRVDSKCANTITESDLNSSKELSPLLKKIDSTKCAIPLHEFPKRLGVNSPAKVHRPSEKETRVEKSPSTKSYDLDEIKFADDESDDVESEDSNNSVCNKKPYQDSNIITSNNS